MRYKERYNKEILEKSKKKLGGVRVPSSPKICNVKLLIMTMAV